MTPVATNSPNTDNGYHNDYCMPILLHLLAYYSCFLAYMSVSSSDFGEFRMIVRFNSGIPQIVESDCERICKRIDFFLNKKFFKIFLKNIKNKRYFLVYSHQRRRVPPSPFRQIDTSRSACRTTVVVGIEVPAGVV